MSAEAKNPNGPVPLRPVPLCHRLLAAPADVDRSCIGSACSMWAFARTDEQAGPDGFCSEVKLAGGYMPSWADPAQDTLAPAEPASGPAEPTEPVSEPGPPIERLRYEGKRLRWRWFDGYHRLVPGGCAVLSQLAAVMPNGKWFVWDSAVIVSGKIAGIGSSPDVPLAQADAIRTLIAKGVLTVEPEPVAHDRTTENLIRALGDSEAALAAARQELEKTRGALAEAEAELERLGSTRAVSYEYQIKWES